MAYEQKPNSGALFRNDKKNSDSQPDYRGECLINGVQMQISAWLTTSKSSGKKFFSMKFQPKQQRLGPAPHDKELPGERPEGIDDPPF